MSSQDATGRRVVQDLGAWVVVMEWPEGVINGGPGRLVIEPADGYPIGGLSQTVLRQVDFKDGIERFRKQLAASERRSQLRDDYENKRGERIRAALSAGVTDEYLALLASAYISAANRGQPMPNEYLAEVVGKTTSTVRGHLWQARKRDLLTGSPGRVGGQLTPKAVAILERIVPRGWESPAETVKRVRET
jgi:hypothetical protein